MLVKSTFYEKNPDHFVEEEGVSRMRITAQYGHICLLIHAQLIILCFTSLWERVHRQLPCHREKDQPNRAVLHDSKIGQCGCSQNGKLSIELYHT